MEGEFMEGNIGEMALLGDVWYQIMDKRYGVNELSKTEGNEYLLYNKDYWIPESWIKDTKQRWYQQRKARKENAI